MYDNSKIKLSGMKTFKGTLIIIKVLFKEND